MKSSLFLSSFASALILAPVLASAQAQEAPPNRPNQRQAGGQLGRGGQAGMGMGMMQKRQSMKAELGLTDVQQADIRKVRENAQRDRLRKATDFKIASLDLKSLLRAEKVDEKAVAAKLADVQAAQGALLKVRVDTALAMKRILTPEQQKKMSEMRGQHGAAMGQRMGQRHNMRGAMGRGQGRGRMGQPMGRGMHGNDSDPFDQDDNDDLDPEGPTVR
jgi:protein CpxP